MKIARQPHPDTKALHLVPFGTPFYAHATLYTRTNPGAHNDASYGWGQEVEEGLLTRFDPKMQVIVVDGEFVQR